MISLTHSQNEMIKTLVINILQRPLHGQGKFYEKRQMFPACQYVLVLLQMDTVQIGNAWVTKNASTIDLQRIAKVLAHPITFGCWVMFSPLAAM